MVEITQCSIIATFTLLPSYLYLQCAITTIILLPSHLYLHYVIVTIIHIYLLCVTATITLLLPKPLSLHWVIVSSQYCHHTSLYCGIAIWHHCHHTGIYFILLPPSHYCNHTCKYVLLLLSSDYCHLCTWNGFWVSLGIMWLPGFLQHARCKWGHVKGWNR